MTIDFEHDVFDDGLDPRLRICVREMRLAKTPLAKLGAIKRELAKIAPTILDKQPIVDALMPIAEDIGLTKEVGEAIEYAILHALSQHERGNGHAACRNGGIRVLNAGRDIGDLIKLPPRPFLLATAFCKGNASMLGGAGAAGKTSVRIAQYLALATGRKLTGEHVFKRSRVLLLLKSGPMRI